MEVLDLSTSHIQCWVLSTLSDALILRRYYSQTFVTIVPSVVMRTEGTVLRRPIHHGRPNPEAENMHWDNSSKRGGILGGTGVTWPNYCKDVFLYHLEEGHGF